jgi:hypothetical protein
MTKPLHFHNLASGGIPRQLTEGIRARVFPGIIFAPPREEYRQPGSG